MKSYFAVVEPGDNRHAHGIIFPDLPGVVSAADSENDILANAIESLELWAEDMELPEPSRQADIVAREDVRAILTEGGYLLSVPLIEKDSVVVRANVSFERGMLRAIDQEAERRHQTRAAFLADAALHEIKRINRGLRDVTRNAKLRTRKSRA